MPANAYLRFTLEYPGGAKQDVSVDSDRVTVGSGAHCEIRLAGEGVAVEQLEVEARGGGVFAEARSMTPAALLNGLPFTRGRLLPNSTLHIGSVKLQVEAAEATARPIVMRAKQKQDNPLIWVLAAVGFPLGLYVVLTAGPREAALGAAPEAPPLWSQAEGEACVHQDPAVADAQAAAYLEQANARRERSPFSPRDGVASVALYTRAATCFSQAQNGADARLATDEAEYMRQTTSRQFHVHQVRLERALATKEYDSAQAEARLLEAFVGPGAGEAGNVYSGWLSDLQRRIKVKAATKKKKK